MMRRAGSQSQHGKSGRSGYGWAEVMLQPSVLTERKEEDGISPLTVASPMSEGRSTEVLLEGGD